jgi:hypothetical protein
MGNNPHNAHTHIQKQTSKEIKKHGGKFPALIDTDRGFLLLSATISVLVAHCWSRKALVFFLILQEFSTMRQKEILKEKPKNK